MSKRVAIAIFHTHLLIKVWAQKVDESPEDLSADLLEKGTLEKLGLVIKNGVSETTTAKVGGLPLQMFVIESSDLILIGSESYNDENITHQKEYSPVVDIFFQLAAFDFTLLNN